jgi:hypothetical protein
VAKSEIAEAIYYIGEEASAQSSGFNITDALVGTRHVRHCPRDRGAN